MKEIEYLKPRLVVGMDSLANNWIIRKSENLDKKKAQLSYTWEEIEKTCREDYKPFHVKLKDNVEFNAQAKLLILDERLRPLGRPFCSGRATAYGGGLIMYKDIVSVLNLQM